MPTVIASLLRLMVDGRLGGATAVNRWGGIISLNSFIS
jgi:hypothetical protein